MGELLAKVSHWLYVRFNYGARCVHLDTEDFPEELSRPIHPHCRFCQCGRCQTCVTWEDYDTIWKMER